MEIDPETQHRLTVLSWSFERKRKLYNIIFVLSVIVVAAAVLAFLLMTANPETLRNNSTLISASTVISVMVCVSLRDLIILRVSRSLRAIVKESESLLASYYMTEENEEDMTDEEPAGQDSDVFDEQEEYEPLVEKKPFVRTKGFVVVLVLILGFVTLFSSFVVAGYDHSTSVGLLVMAGIFLLMVGGFSFSSRRIRKGVVRGVLAFIILFGPLFAVAPFTTDMPEGAGNLLFTVAFLSGTVLLLVYIWYLKYLPRRKNRRFVTENEGLFEIREADRQDVVSEILNKKKDRAVITVPYNGRHHVIIEKYAGGDPPRFEKQDDLEFADLSDAFGEAVRGVVALYRTDDGRPEFELEHKDRKLAEANLKEIYEKLQKYDQLRDKITIDDAWVTIRFHEYLEVKMSGRLECSFLDRSWYPSENQELLEFVDDLVNERIIFYQKNIRKQRFKTYPGFAIDGLLMETNKKKNRRVFSAMRIYAIPQGRRTETKWWA